MISCVQPWCNGGIVCIHITNTSQLHGYNHTQKQKLMNTTPSCYIYIGKTVPYSQIKMTHLWIKRGRDAGVWGRINTWIDREGGEGNHSTTCHSQLSEARNEIFHLDRRPSEANMFKFYIKKKNSVFGRCKLKIINCGSTSWSETKFAVGYPSPLTDFIVEKRYPQSTKYK